MQHRFTPNPARVSCRAASTGDIPELKRLLLEQGPNQWNHLPRVEVEAHLDGIATGETRAVLALDGSRIVGMATFNIGDFYAEYESEADRLHPRGYIAEAVVHSGYAGRGIGSLLLEQAKTAMHTTGVQTIYVKRHEENAASAGMMRKAGFTIVDTFPDEIRVSGSRRTTVERFRFTSENRDR